jgi:hypothetical protein
LILLARGEYLDLRERTLRETLENNITTKTSAICTQQIFLDDKISIDKIGRSHGNRKGNMSIKYKRENLKGRICFGDLGVDKEQY